MDQGYSLGKARRNGHMLLFPKLLLDKGHFKNYFRMSLESFEYLVDAIQPEIQKMDTKFRLCISARERLALTLRFLATGKL